MGPKPGLRIHRFLLPPPLCRGSSVSNRPGRAEGFSSGVDAWQIGSYCPRATQGQTQLKPLSTCTRVWLGGFWDKLEVGMTGKRPSQDSRPEGLGFPSFRTARLDTPSSPSPAKHVGDTGELVARIVHIGTSSPSPPQPWDSARGGLLWWNSIRRMQGKCASRFSVLFSANATENGEKIEAGGPSQYRCSYSAKPHEKTMPLDLDVLPLKGATSFRNTAEVQTNRKFHSQFRHLSA